MRRSLKPVILAPPGWVLRVGSVLPLFDADFANGRAWVKGMGTVSPAALMSNTNSTGGYVTNADGLLIPVPANTLRTASGTGQMIEQSNQNLFLRSGDLSDAAWRSGGANPTIVSSNNLAPDGSLTATRVTFGSSGASALRQAVVVTNNQPVTISFYVKLAPSNAATNIRICTNNGGAWNTGGDAIIALTNSWQRITLTYQNTFGIGIAAYLGAQKSDITEDATCKGDALVWGGQFEPNVSIPSSYIATTTVSVTRSADQVKFSAAMTAMLPSVTGTYRFEMGPVAWGGDSLDHTLMSFNNASDTPGLGRYSGGFLQLNDGVGYRTSQAYTSGAAFKYAVAFGGAAINSSLNGGALSTYASYAGAIASTGTPFNIGGVGGGSYWNGAFKRITAYSTALNAQNTSI